MRRYQSQRLAGDQDILESPMRIGLLLNNQNLQSRRRVLKHRRRSQSPRRATLRKYRDNRPSGDENIYTPKNISL